MSAARPARALAGVSVWRLKGTGTRHIPCHFVHLCRVTSDRLITFQYFNFLKRMYVTQCNKDLSQRAKPKSDPVVSPFHEHQQLDQEKKQSFVKLLHALVVSTASAGFAMAPVPFDLTCFLLASLGTGLASCAANSINQVPELELPGLCLWNLVLLSAPLHSGYEAE
ncbi:hypothetical protein WISP_145731 [Willisornis vidua]|uniref:Protoheme IX farnesyltransferase, mitochondrial n=1 Tax=Willisornis vidua TaxID=1566151 RepID=A0ABQ9CKW2_9PASS|nr:hypothetical protein WISP_145731 [Willisornis vidua]